jgi:hypothetical protein
MCVAALNRTGGYAKGGNAYSKMNVALIEREGPRPEGAICRHLCENDTTAPNGFICILHTTWGTQAENMADRPLHKRGGWQASAIRDPEKDRRRANIAGTAASKIEHTCQHCGRIVRGPSIGRHVKACAPVSRYQSVT